jgi:hypothetical protein
VAGAKDGAGVAVTVVAAAVTVTVLAGAVTVTVVSPRVPGVEAGVQAEKVNVTRIRKMLPIAKDNFLLFNPLLLKIVIRGWLKY